MLCRRRRVVHRGRGGDGRERGKDLVNGVGLVLEAAKGRRKFRSLGFNDHAAGGQAAGALVTDQTATSNVYEEVIEPEEVRPQYGICLLYTSPSPRDS